MAQNWPSAELAPTAPMGVRAELELAASGAPTIHSGYLQKPPFLVMKELKTNVVWLYS